MSSRIQGVVWTLLKRFEDERGWLIQLFRQDQLEDKNLPVMAYASMTKPGVSRGPHEHVDQTDLFVFFGPGVFRVYLWDNRPESPTYGQQEILDVGQDWLASLIVPPGVVHGYKCVSAIPGLVFNAPNRLYRGSGGQGEIDEIRHESDSNSKFKIN